MSNILSHWWNYTEGASVVPTVNDLMVHWFHYASLVVMKVYVKQLHDNRNNAHIV